MWAHVWTPDRPWPDDSDGSIAEASVVRDPGDGMGAAALRAVREFRFAPRSRSSSAS
jgi:hypothetical protein